MPGKRRKIEEDGSDVTPGKRPLSAIAAARARAEAAVKGIPAPEVTLESVSLPPTPEPLHPYSGRGYSGRGTPEIKQDGLSVKPRLRLCSWRNDASNILTDTESELSINLSKHTTIALVGCFDFKVLKGAVHINGANIGFLDRAGRKGALHRVYASAAHPILKLRGLDATNHVQFISCKEPTFFTKISPLFDDLWHVPCAFKPQRSFIIVTDAAKDPLLRPLIPDKTTEDWLRASENCSSRPAVTVVTGSPASGKTVFAKRLTNRLLTGLGRTCPPVAATCYLDLNPSKQEYAPHGQISLVMVRELNLCPTFTHPSTRPIGSNPNGNETLRAHPIPTDLVNYMEYYQSCVEDLFLTFQALQSRDTTLSLVVDTPGFLTASASEVLAKLIARLKPHHIVHLGALELADSENATMLNMIHTTASQYGSTVHDISAQEPPTATMRSESELESMQIQSYFHSRDSSKKLGGLPTLCWTQEPLSHMVPWEISYQETVGRRQDFVGFAMYTEPIEARSLVHALNGSVVHVVQSTSAVIPHPYTGLPRTGKHEIPYFASDERTAMVRPLDPRTSTLVCTAIIRGFDHEKRVAQLLVPKVVEPLMYQIAPERTVLVSGCCSMPEWAFMEEAYARERTTCQGKAVMSTQDTDGQPWVMGEEYGEMMGYLNTVRRVRKFQT